MALAPVGKVEEDTRFWVSDKSDKNEVSTSGLTADNGSRTHNCEDDGFVTTEGQYSEVGTMCDMFEVKEISCMFNEVETAICVFSVLDDAFRELDTTGNAFSEAKTTEGTDKDGGSASMFDTVGIIGGLETTEIGFKEVRIGEEIDAVVGTEPSIYGDDFSKIKETGVDIDKADIEQVETRGVESSAIGTTDEITDT